MRYVSYEIESFGAKPEKLPPLATREEAIAAMLKIRQAGIGVACIARDKSGRGRMMVLTPNSCKLKPAI